MYMYICVYVYVNVNVNVNVIIIIKYNDNNNIIIITNNLERGEQLFGIQLHARAHARDVAAKEGDFVSLALLARNFFTASLYTHTHTQTHTHTHTFSKVSVIIYLLYKVSVLIYLLFKVSVLIYLLFKVTVHRTFFPPPTPYTCFSLAATAGRNVAALSLYI
jgi:hypothetical protein